MILLTVLGNHSTGHDATEFICVYEDRVKHLSAHIFKINISQLAPLQRVWGDTDSLGDEFGEDVLWCIFLVIESTVEIEVLQEIFQLGIISNTPIHFQSSPLDIPGGSRYPTI